MSRLRTGVVQCEDDWPGVFIRGDNTERYIRHLKYAAGLLPKDKAGEAAKIGLEEIVELMARCNINNALHSVDHHVMTTCQPSLNAPTAKTTHPR